MSSDTNVVSEVVLNSSNMLDDDKYLTIRIDNEEYALEVKSILEIVGIVTITPLPNLPEYIKGVINLRGKVYPVIDIRIRFNIKEKEYNDRTCIIIVQNKEFSVGLIVDDVNEVISIPQKMILPPPKIVKSKAGRFINGLGKTNSGIKLLLDTEKILFDSEEE